MPHSSDIQLYFCLLLCHSSLSLASIEYHTRPLLTILPLPSPPRTFCLCWRWRNGFRHKTLQYDPFALIRLYDGGQSKRQPKPNGQNRNSSILYAKRIFVLFFFSGALCFRRKIQSTPYVYFASFSVRFHFEAHYRCRCNGSLHIHMLDDTKYTYKQNSTSQYIYLHQSKTEMVSILMV